MANRPSLDDYVDVAERIQDFKDAHPDGSLQTIAYEVREVGNATFIVYRAAAYRTPDDQRPGHGIAWEPFPGRTPYTKDSELMNAETAAWGRAIVALGLVANRKLASRQEVRNRMEDQKADAESDAPKAAKPAQAKAAKPEDQTIDDAVLAQLHATYKASGLDRKQLCWFLLAVGVEALPEEPSGEDIGRVMSSLTLKQALELDALLKGEDESTPGSGS